MAKIYSKENRGFSRRRLGDVNVNSLNVSPEPISASASGTTMRLSDLQSFDFYVVQSGNSAHVVRLPSGCSVGTYIVLYVGDNGFRLQPAAGSGEALNNGAGENNYVPLSANSRAECFKDTSTHWTVHQIATNGALTAPSAV